MYSFFAKKRVPLAILFLGITVRLILVVLANYTWKNSGWQGIFLGGDWNWEGFLDYEFWYTSGGSTPEEDHGFTRMFLTGELPYRDWGAAYNMTPLFLFMIEPFWVLPLGWWGPAIPIIICDALTGVAIYGIAKQLFHNEEKAMIAGICAALAPISLFYVGYLWLNPGIFTFFSIVSIYYLLVDKYDTSAIFLGLAVMSKQVAGIFLPFMLVFMARSRQKVEESGLIYILSSMATVVLVLGMLLQLQSDMPLHSWYVAGLLVWVIVFVLYFFKKSWLLRYFLIFTAICVAISAPFLLVYPTEYISMLRSRATGPVWGVFIFPKYNETVGFTAMLQHYQELGYNIPTGIITFIGVAVNTYAAFIVALVIVLLSLEQELRNKSTNSLEGKAFFSMAAFAAITIMIGLFPLGVYKYYIASLAPFWALYAVETGYAISPRRFVGLVSTIGLWAGFNCLVLFAHRIWNPYLAVFPFIIFFLPLAIRRPKTLLRPLYSLEYFLKRTMEVAKPHIRRLGKR